MTVEVLQRILEDLNGDTEIMIEGVYNIKYRIKDFKLVKTSDTEELYLITGDE